MTRTNIFLEFLFGVHDYVEVVGFQSVKSMVYHINITDIFLIAMNFFLSLQDGGTNDWIFTRGGSQDKTWYDRG